MNRFTNQFCLVEYFNYYPVLFTFGDYTTSKLHQEVYAFSF